MRSIINISLPRNMAKDVEAEIKGGKFASKSEFFRSLLRDWQESKLLKELKDARREIEEGKGKILRSLKDIG